MPEQSALMSEDELDRITSVAVAIYNQRLKGVLEPSQNGRTVALHLDSGDYALARNSSEARRALRGRHPEGMIATLLVGPNQLDQLAVRMLGNPNFARVH